MKRRRLTIVTACAALGTAAITAWFCIPILQERRYLNLIADENLNALDDDRKREVFEKLADLSRCKNLDRLVRGAYHGDEEAHGDTEEFDLDDLLAELESEHGAPSWREVAQDSAAEVVRRCQGSFDRLLGCDIDESIRFPAICLAGAMGHDAAFAKPELLRILTNSEEEKELRLKIARLLSRMSTADEWSEMIAGVLRTDNDEEIRKPLISEVCRLGSPTDSLLETLHELSNVDALSLAADSALLILEPNMLNTRRALSHLGKDAERDIEGLIPVLASLLQPAVQPFLDALEEQDPLPAGLVTFRKLKQTVADAPSILTPIVAPPIDVVISDVLTEEELVSLSLGSGDHVERGYEFTVARGNEFIGKVQIVRVQSTTAYARVLYTREGETVRPGDQAFTP